MPLVVIRTSEENNVFERATASTSAPLGVLTGSQFSRVGETIDTPNEGFLRGHGTTVVDDQLVASVCGVVERVDKLVSVRPVRTRYNAELGDVVIGRVTEVVAKRWKVDLDGRQDASILLSAVNLPGDVQRRRTAEDELTMRNLYVEGDLLSAEVQAVNADNSVHLHTRSTKYGKLMDGLAVHVPHSLIKRLKQHFNTLERAGVDVILGCNGMVWVSAVRDAPDPAAGASGDGAPVPRTPLTAEERQRVVRVANAFRGLAVLNLPIYPAVIEEIFEASVSGGFEPQSMLGPDFLAAVAEFQAQRLQSGE